MFDLSTTAQRCSSHKLPLEGAGNQDYLDYPLDGLAGPESDTLLGK